MMYAICYVSDERKELNKEDLILLYEQTVYNNYREQITGVLIYKDGSFFQVLEGEHQIITSLFDKIKKDKRHMNVITLFKRESDRVFDDYLTGFSIVDNYQGLESLRIFLADKRAVSTTSACVESIIKSYLKA
ncbi:BLUF domain-containing protein [Leeuwenhoekiella parthenopeia]|uniref:BLUF domain-containing protein n=1 Tax=Leeuwenhoekiella parthenopeia TaxID=2890320 RepID=A0ABS8GTG9_9FLAO|nr:BLUF domain-containing protein [Leeuwenhoekiella parthenopeia]MCC4213063.1 BLUF domain-containing protein [Leeuwenhoekiella parthenopeia]